MNDYICLGFRQESLLQGIQSEITQLQMLTLEIRDSVIFGGSSDQTSTSNFLSDLDPSPTARSKFFPPFNALPVCISAVASSQLYIFSSCIHLQPANFDVVGASYGWNVLFVSLSDSQKNGFDTSLARIQSLSCISSIFSFPLPTFFFVFVGR